jgi:hypothetical protein
MIADPPDEVLREIGRITVRGTHLEDVLAWLDAGVNDADLGASVKRPAGVLLDRLRGGAERLPSAAAARLTSWLTSAGDALNQRHEAVHSFERVVLAGGQISVRRWHARRDVFWDYDVAALNNVAEALRTTADEGLGIAFDLAQGHERRPEP